MRPKVIECGACGHPDYHCPASGCNHAECDCEKFRQVTELELTMLEDWAAHRKLYRVKLKDGVVTNALHRLHRKGCLRLNTDSTKMGYYVITESGRAVLLGTSSDILQSILGLVIERPPTVESLASLTRDQREELRDWAGREHLRASDNVVRRKPRPAWLDGLPKEGSSMNRYELEP